MAIYLRETFQEALTRGHRDIVDFLVTNYLDFCTATWPRLLDLVCSGRMDMAKKFYHPDKMINHNSGWVHSRNDYFTLRHPAVFLWHLFQVKSPCLGSYKSNNKPIHDPSRHEFVKWCLSDRLLRDTELLYVTRWATQYGDLDLVRALVALGVDLEVGYKDLAANNSRLLWAVTQYTKAGDIACMILRQSPSLIDEDVVKWATRYRRMEVLECVEELIAEDRSRLVSTDVHSILHAAIVIASGYGRVEVLEWALGACIHCLGSRDIRHQGRRKQLYKTKTN